MHIVNSEGHTRLYVLDMQLAKFVELSTMPRDRESAVIDLEAEMKIRTNFGKLLSKDPFTGPLEIPEDLGKGDEFAEVSVMTWARQILHGVHPLPLRQEMNSGARLIWEIRREHVGEFL